MQDHYLIRIFKILLLTVFITACGGGNSSSSEKTVAPSVSSAAISGKGETGSILTGSYEFHDLGNDGDASEIYWQHPNGTKIAIGRTLVPDLQLVGWDIKFCVQAISAGKRLVGNIICSDGITITEPYILAIPKISIVNKATNTQVGATLSALTINDYDYSISYQWFINDETIASATSDDLVLIKEWQGARAHVCINDIATGNVLACTEKTNFIQARSSYAPEITFTPLPSHIEVGDSLQAEYSYLDKDNDEEDLNRLSYRWYIDGTTASIKKHIIINEEDALKKLKLCITIYSKTGLPDTSEQQCLSEQTIWHSSNKAPDVTKIEIKGISMAGYKIGATYQYFDANNHNETESDTGWFINDIKIESSKELLLTSEMTEKNTYAEYCVVPKDSSGTVGARVCERQGFANIQVEGALTRGSIITPILKDYPEFNESWWKTVGESIEFYHFYEIGKNEVNAWIGSSYSPSISVNFRELAFCIKADKLNGGTADICTTLTREHGLTKGLEIDKNNLQRIGFDPQAEIDFSINGKNYRAYRPVSEATFNRFASSLGLVSPESIQLGNLTSIKMTPADAQAYCQRTKPLGQITSREAITALFTGDATSAYNLWPSPHTTPWLSATDDGSLVTLSEFQTINFNAKYPFSCMSPL